MKMERGYPVYTVTPKAENVILRGIRGCMTRRF